MQKRKIEIGSGLGARRKGQKIETNLGDDFEIEVLATENLFVPKLKIEKATLNNFIEFCGRYEMPMQVLASNALREWMIRELKQQALKADRLEIFFLEGLSDEGAMVWQEQFPEAGFKDATSIQSTNPVITEFAELQLILEDVRKIESYKKKAIQTLIDEACLPILSINPILDKGNKIEDFSLIRAYWRQNISFTDLVSIS